MSTKTVACPHAHGALRALKPATLDGAGIVVGGCITCGGLWVPMDAVHRLFPNDVLLRFAESGYIDEGPRCGRCEGGPPMRQQRIGEIEVDRCPVCLGLWLDGGEMWALGGGSEEAETHTTCDVCAHPLGPYGADRIQATALGNLCPPCAGAPGYEVDAAVTLNVGMGGESGDRMTRKQILNGEVEVVYDEDGGAVRFQWSGELLNSPIRGSITHENRISRFFRAVGVTDLEVGSPAFDSVFRVSAEMDEPMHEWIANPEVQRDLLTAYEIAGVVVVVHAESFTVAGQMDASAIPPVRKLEEACERLYRSLRSQRRRLG